MVVPSEGRLAKLSTLTKLANYGGRVVNLIDFANRIEWSSITSPIMVEQSTSVDSAKSK